MSMPQALADEVTADDHMTRSLWLSWLGRLEGAGELDGLRRYQIQNLDVWPIIKATLIMEELNRNQRKRFVATAPVKVASVPPAAEKQAAVEQTLDCDVLFLANTAPAIEVGGVLLNPHLDPLRNALEKMGVRTLTAYYDSAPESLICAFPSIGLSERLRQTRASTSPAKPALRKLRDILCNFLEGKHEVHENTCDDIVKRIENTLKLRARYQSLFSSNPKIKCLLVTNYYSPNGWAAVSAAKSLKIPTIDIQHGLQGRYHHAYSWPELKTKTLSCVPDHFLCWTRHDQENLDEYPLTRGKSEVIGPGHFQLERLVEEGAATQGAAASGSFTTYRQLSSQLLLTAEKARSENRQIVGVFLQYKEDEQWLEALRKSVPLEIELWVRRHPGVRRLDPNPRTAPGIRFVDNFPLTSVLNAIDAVVTGYSSVGLEASYLGHPVVAYSPLAKEFLEPYCASTGFWITSSNPEAVATAISDALPTKAATAAGLPDVNSIAEGVLKLCESHSLKSKCKIRLEHYFRKLNLKRLLSR